MAEKIWIPYEELTAEQKAMVDSAFWFERLEAAKQGHGLDKLVDDEAWNVRCEVAHYMRDHALTLEEWIAANPEKCGLEENRSRDAMANGARKAKDPRAMTPPGADKPAKSEKATVGKDASDMRANRKAGHEVGAKKQGRGL